MGLFCSELDAVFYRIYVFEEFFFVGCFDDNKGVINKPFPQSGGFGAVLRALVSNSSIEMFAIMGLNGDPRAAPSNCS